MEDKLNLNGVFINRDPQMDVLDTVRLRTSGLTGSHSKVWSMPTSKYSRKKDETGQLLLTLIITHLLAMGMGITLGVWVVRRNGGAGM